jgi:hypothetical protein
LWKTWAAHSSRDQTAINVLALIKSKERPTSMACYQYLMTCLPGILKPKDGNYEHLVLSIRRDGVSLDVCNNSPVGQTKSNIDNGQFKAEFELLSWCSGEGINGTLVDRQALREDLGHTGKLATVIGCIERGMRVGKERNMPGHIAEYAVEVIAELELFLLNNPDRYVDKKKAVEDARDWFDEKSDLDEITINSSDADLYSKVLALTELATAENVVLVGDNLFDLYSEHRAILIEDAEDEAMETENDAGHESEPVNICHLDNSIQGLRAAVELVKNQLKTLLDSFPLARRDDNTVRALQSKISSLDVALNGLDLATTTEI